MLEAAYNGRRGKSAARGHKGERENSASMGTRVCVRETMRREDFVLPVRSNDSECGNIVLKRHRNSGDGSKNPHTDLFFLSGKL